LGPAFDEMRSSPRVEVVTERSLKFLLLAIRTLEAFVVAEKNPGLDLSPPSRRALYRYWRWHTRPRFLRGPTSLSPDPPAIARAVAEARLHVECGVVATSPEALRREYRMAFGAWPFAEPRDMKTFYEREYERIWDAADRLHDLLDRSPIGRLEEYP
jgi:hypothetical protein